MRDALQVGDTVVTTAGIYGTVMRVRDDKRAVLLRVADNPPRILIKYEVGRDLNFTLEQCGHCHGIWFDKNQ